MGLHAARAHRRSYTHSGLPTWLVKMYIPRAQHMCGYKLLWCVPKRCTWAHMTLMINATCWSSSAGVSKEKHSSQCGVEPSPCLCQLAGRKHTGRRWRCQACGGTEKGARSCSTLCRSLHGQEAAHTDIIPDQKEGMMHPVIHTLPCILLDQYICSHQRSTLHPAGLIDPGDYGVARWEE